MAFSKYGFHGLGLLGSPSTSADAGTNRKVHAYISNDLLSAIVASNYFLTIYQQLTIGDVIMVSADADGTPNVGFLVVTAATSSSVTTALKATEVSGDQAAIADLSGTLTGTTDGALADVAAIALSTSNTYTDAAVNAAVNTAITSVNLQIKELQTKLNAALAMMRTAGLLAP